jgi:transposase
VSREPHGPEEILRDNSGYSQADAYGGCDGVFLKSNGSITEVACWGHARRYWHKARVEDPARAYHVLAVITKLYQEESDTPDLSAPTRRFAREQVAGPLLEDLKKRLDAELFLPKSQSGKAAM